MLKDRAEQNASQILLERLRCQNSLHEFVRQAWPNIEGDNPFIDGWWIQAICEHLEAVFRGEIPKLMINVPPRTGKTSIISIMWPAWGFVNDPSVKFLYSSYAQKISLDHSRLCKMLIECPWFRSRWGDTVRLSKDQATKGHFTTTALGHRIATSVNAGGTALGGNILVMDDPNDAKDGESQVKRDSTNDWVSRVWPSRLNPGRIQGQVLVQQRVHEKDVSGYLMEQGWVKLILPMEFEKRRKAITVPLKSTNGEKWEDPRKEDGELLCPGYLNSDAIKNKKAELGKYNFAGQYQQSPNPAGGGLVNRADFRIWNGKLPNIQLMVQSIDTALTDKTYSDHSACSTWGTFVDENLVTNVILLYVWKDKVTYPDLLKRAIRLYKNSSDVYEEELKEDRSLRPDYVLIESKAAGHPLLSDLSMRGILVKPFNPTRYKDKTNRLNLVSPFIENGRVWVIGDKSGKDGIVKGHNELIDDCCLFPNGDSDDLVDTMTQVLLHLREKGILTHSANLSFTRDKVPKDQMPKKWDESEERRIKK